MVVVGSFGPIGTGTPFECEHDVSNDRLALQIGETARSLLVRRKIQKRKTRRRRKMPHGIRSRFRKSHRHASKGPKGVHQDVRRQRPAGISVQSVQEQGSIVGVVLFERLFCRVVVVAAVVVIFGISRKFESFRRRDRIVRCRLRPRLLGRRCLGGSGVAPVVSRRRASEFQSLGGAHVHGAGAHGTRLGGTTAATVTTIAMKRTLLGRRLQTPTPITTSSFVGVLDVERLGRSRVGGKYGGGAADHAAAADAIEMLLLLGLFGFAAFAIGLFGGDFGGDEIV
mmetsp:Transcript_24414/g.50218  ORF Transcript_24414/g.50218 Transcript_24414/m.50218 type:complete len:283 (-) Transcript_24414:62-910(-)